MERPLDSLEASLAELKSLPLFADLTRGEMNQLCVGARACYTQHRETIFRAGEDAAFFGVVLSGAYKLTKSSPNGEDVIVHFAVPGDVIAAFIMPLPNSKFPITATAMGPSRFLKLPRENFLNYWKPCPDLILSIQSALALRMQQLQDEKMMLKAPLAKKLAILLISLLEKSNASDQEQGLIPLQLTRKEIADNLGASVESIIRIMSDWSKKGVLETTDRQIRILKTDKLIQEMSVE